MVPIEEFFLAISEKAVDPDFIESTMVVPLKSQFPLCQSHRGRSVADGEPQPEEQLCARFEWIAPAELARIRRGVRGERMRKRFSAVGLILGLASASLLSQPAPLTTLSAIHQLTNEQAAQRLPVDFEATVTFYRSYEATLFVQDGDYAIFVRPPSGTQLEVGDRVRIHGVTHESFRPYVNADKISLLAHGQTVRPTPATFEELIQGRLDCRLVTVRGRVLSADIVVTSDQPSMVLELLLDGVTAEVQVDSDDASAIPRLLDAEVEVTGAFSGQFDGKMQMTGLLLHTQDLGGLRVVQAPAATPWSEPLTPMGDILDAFRENNQSQRVRVEGTITYYMPGSAVVLQNGSKSLWINTRMRGDLRVGDRADATGLPDVHDGFLNLADSEVRDSRVPAPVAPIAVSWLDLTQSHHIFDLVSVEGQVVAEVREAAQDEYVLVNNGHLFSAIYRHPVATGETQEALPEMKQIAEGSTVRVAGICILEDSNPFNAEVPFDILLRSADDIAVVARPAWLNVRHLIALVAVLLAVIFIIGIRVVWSERRARQHNAAMAHLERQRGRILEEINSSRPLAEILERITEVVSVRLGAAPCWVQVTDGAILGTRPPQTRLCGMRVAQQEISARSGPALGTIYAAFETYAKPHAAETEALSMAAGLATLAIETSQLYSDLVHRSEYDLLTDIANRFSFDKHLETLIAGARQCARILAIIYIDLDRFKQVNDQFGHQVGDMYLQNAALRMKRQLRPGDMLARLGGDEFAALIAMVPNRREVEEIALRLQRCFDVPFEVEGHVVKGSASVGIALYPEDAVSRDGLLTRADADMYAMKQMRQNSHPARAGSQDPDLVSKHST